MPASIFFGDTANLDTFDNQSINDYLNSGLVKTSFVQMVTSYSVILGQYRNRQDEVINIALRQVYPRIALILAAAKDDKGFYRFSSKTDITGTDTDDTIRTNVNKFLTNPNNPFNEGILAAASAYTAAFLIRSIPLNTDIKNIDLGDNLEEQAIKDIERIIELLASASASSIGLDSGGVTTRNNSIYLTLDINKSTIPANLFDATTDSEGNEIPLDGSIDFDKVRTNNIPTVNVKQLQSITVPIGKKCFGWVYYSTREIGLTEPYKEEAIFEINTGDTVDKITSNLSDTINNVTLQNVNIGRQANILAAPNIERSTSKKIKIGYLRSDLYPEGSEYDKRIGGFSYSPEISYIDFAARRNDTAVTNDILIVGFYTIDSAVDLSPYLGRVGSSASIALGSIRRSGLNYVEGLLIGSSSNYIRFRKESPVSLLIQVEAGKVQTDSTTTKDSKETTYSPDTFYFQLENNIRNTPIQIAPDVIIQPGQAFPINGTIKLRISTTHPYNLTELFPYVNEDDGTIQIGLENVTSAEEVAEEVLKALYILSPYTEVIGSLAFPNAVQISNFRLTKEEIKEVVDLFLLDDLIITGTTVNPLLPTDPNYDPNFISETVIIRPLKIATGNVIQARTDYKPYSRSIVVSATMLEVKTTKTNTTTDDKDKLPNNEKYGVAKTVRTKPSRIMQNALDKIDKLYKVY